MTLNPIDLRDLARQQKSLRRMAFALVADEHQAEDVVQDAWLRALETRRADQGAFGAWMATVTRRLSLNKLRGKRRRDHREREAAQEEALPSSVEIAARVEIGACLLSALDGLSEPHCTVLRDRYLGDLTPAQIAQRDGVSINTVKSRLSRARAELRERLDRDGLGAEANWALSIAPLLDLPGGWPGASTIAAIGSSLSGAPAIGGILIMKKGLAIVALLLISGIAWRWTQSLEQDGIHPSEQSALSPVSSADLPSTETEELIVSEAGVRAPADDSTSANEAVLPEITRPWSVSGRARTATQNGGVPGVAFDLKVHGGYDLEGPVLFEEQVVSGADGSFAWEFEHPGRTVTIRVESPNSDDQVVVTYGPYLVVEGEDAPWIDALVFSIDGRLSGTVRDPNETPVAGARVKGLFGETETTIEGAYEMRISTRAWGAVKATAQGHGGDFHDLQDLVAGETTRLDFTLTKAIRIEGEVRDALGSPIAGARVHSSANMGDDVFTDSAGRFLLDTVAYIPGDRVWVNARA